MVLGYVKENNANLLIWVQIHSENNLTYCHVPTYTLLANHPVALMLHNLTCS